MIEHPARRRALATALAMGLVLGACGGGGDDDAATASTEAETTNTVADTTTTAAESEGESAGEATEETTEEGAVEEASSSEPVRPEVVTAPLSAGPVQVTPTHCAIEGFELADTAGSASSIAFAGERLFVATEQGIVAFTVSVDAGCTLTLDTSIGDAGVLHPEGVDSLSGNAAGRLIAGDVFGITVFDVEPGYSYECDGPNGQVTLSDDGTTAIGVFPMSPPERWTLTDTICTLETELSFPELADVKWVDYVGDDLFVGGEGLDEVVYATRYGAAGSGAEQWRAGTGDIGAPGWFGWIHGIAPCGEFTCVVDTNTFQLALVDGAGAIVAGFDLQDGVGVRGWVTPIIQGPDGANYVLLSTTYDDEATGERTYFGEIVRLEVTNG